MKSRLEITYRLPVTLNHVSLSTSCHARVYTDLYHCIDHSVCMYISQKVICFCLRIRVGLVNGHFAAFSQMSLIFGGETLLSARRRRFQNIFHHVDGGCQVWIQFSWCEIVALTCSKSCWGKPVSAMRRMPLCTLVAANVSSRTVFWKTEGQQFTIYLASYASISSKTFRLSIFEFISLSWATPSLKESASKARSFSWTCVFLLRSGWDSDNSMFTAEKTYTMFHFGIWKEGKVTQYYP